MSIRNLFISVVFFFVTLGIGFSQNQSSYVVDYHLKVGEKEIPVIPEGMCISTAGDLWIAATVDEYFAHPTVLVFDKNGQCIHPGISDVVNLSTMRYPGTRGMLITEAADHHMLMAGFYNIDGIAKRHEGDRQQAVYVAKMDYATKKIIWRTEIPSGFNSVPKKMLILKNGHILILASGIPDLNKLNYMGEPDEYPRLIILTPEGKLVKDTIPLIAEKGVYGEMNAFAETGSIIESQGNYFFLATTSGEFKTCLIKTDDLLKVVGQKNYQFMKADTVQYSWMTDQHWGVDIQPFSNGDLLISMSNFYEKKDRHWRLMRVDTNGKLVWTKSFPGTTLNPFVTTINQHDEIWMAGNEEYVNLSYYKLKGDGSLIFAKKYPMENFDVVGMEEIEMGGMLMVIERRNNQTDQHWLTLIKTDAEGMFK